jgi:uncharacterized protein (DUF2236 family)
MTITPDCGDHVPGEPPADVLRGLADDAVMQRVGREACVLGGAASAILLQVAHPMVGRGVSEHSRFAEDPLARLRGTLFYVYGITFGTPEEAEWIAAVVTRRHRPVVGEGYSADDPHLQLWVAATLYASACQVYEMVCGPLSAEDREAYCRAARRMAAALGCPAELWPSTVAEFEAYWEDQVAALSVGEDARRICADLMYSKTLPWYLRAFLPVNRLVTAGLLPPSVRDAYGMPWSGSRARVFRAVIGTARVTYRFVPGVVRRLPMTYYMRGLRKKYAATTRTPRPVPDTAPR